MKRVFLLCALICVLSACAGTAVIKKIDDSNACGPGDTYLLPSDGEVWLVLCEDGRVLWIADDEALSK